MPELTSATMQSLHRRMFNRAYKVTRNRDDAEDAVQAAWIRIWKNLDRTNPTNLAGYAARAAANAAIDMRRWEPGRGRQILPVHDCRAALLVEDPAPTPLDVVLANERVDEIRRSLQRLKPDFGRTAIEFYIDGHKAEDIAAREGVSKITVRSRCARAVRAMRVMMSD